MMRTITLEEHYATPAFMEGPGLDLKAQAEAARDHPQVAAGYAKLIEQLCDLDEGRIADMDAAGIDVQVLSLTFPGVEQLDAAEAVAFARETNDLLAKAVRYHPDRFAGFAALPTAAPEAAAAGYRGILRGELRAGGNGPVGDRGLGLAHRDGNPRPPPRPRRGVRQVPGPAARGRAYGRGSPVHAAQARDSAARGGD